MRLKIKLNYFKKILICFLFLTSFCISFFCRDELILNNINQIVYKEILFVTTGNFKIVLFITGYDSLTTGYNEVFFKVYKDNSEQNSGFVKLFPKMWMTPTYVHSTPVSVRFDYNNTIGYYSGYVIFNMPTSPPDVVWYSEISYTDANNVTYQADSTAMYVIYHQEKQWRFFYDTTDQSTYMLSLLKPFTPNLGLNDFDVMLHKTDAQLYNHEQINNAEMFIAVYETDSTNFSSGNVSPIPNSDGIYRGKVNFPYTDSWIVSDTIRYLGKYITNNPPPIPTFFFTIQ